VFRQCCRCNTKCYTECSFQCYTNPLDFEALGRKEARSRTVVSSRSLLVGPLEDRTLLSPGVG